MYSLNYLINRQISKVEGKLVVFFVNLRAAFDSVDRGLLIKAMRKKGVRKALVKKCEDVMRETKNKIRRWGKLLDRKGGQAKMPLESIYVQSLDRGFERAFKERKRSKIGWKKYLYMIWSY